MPDNPLQQFACPYDTRLFQNEEDLWVHVSGDHAQLLEELGIKGDTALCRKLLRKEALGKANALAAANQSQERSATNLQYTKDPPKLRKLPLDAQRPRPLPIRVNSSDQSSAGSAEPLPQDGGSPKSTRPTTRAPPSCSHSGPAAAFRPSLTQMSSTIRWPGLLRQPDSRPISQEQLAAEVKSIYAGLTMVETECVPVEKAQAAVEPESSQIKLAPDHWQALIALTRSLLQEHHDFFLASQHPSASPALRRLAAKYSMPARMWKHGIHSFLELLRHRLPDSMEHMLAFIYLAYQMMALLYETVPTFEDTWIECIGDLGRYRMAIEDEDARGQEIWARVARSWYSKTADESPQIGRLYQHLAILACRNAPQQLYYYARSLTCVQPYLSARESVLDLFDPITERSTKSSADSVASNDVAFVKVHSLLSKAKPSQRVQDSEDAAKGPFQDPQQSVLNNVIGVGRHYRIGDHGVLDDTFLTELHAELAFIAALEDKTRIMQEIPRMDLAKYLNTLAKREVVMDVANSGNTHARFYIASTVVPDETKPLPDDFTVRGQIWAQSYFPSQWFGIDQNEEERNDPEPANIQQSRQEKTSPLSLQDARAHPPPTPLNRTLADGSGQQRGNSSHPPGSKIHSRHGFSVLGQAVLTAEQRVGVQLMRRAAVPIYRDDLSAPQRLTEHNSPERYCFDNLLSRANGVLRASALFAIVSFIRPVAAQNLPNSEQAKLDVSRPVPSSLDRFAMRLLTSGVCCGACAAVVLAGDRVKPFALALILMSPIAWWNMCADSLYDAEHEWLLINMWLGSLLGYGILLVMSDKSKSANGSKTKWEKSGMSDGAAIISDTVGGTQSHEKLLILIPDPRNVPALRVQEETQNIHDINDRPRKVRVDIVNRLNCQIGDIAGVVRRDRFTVVHIMAHGDKQGLYFQNEWRKPALVTTSALAAVLSQSRDLKCIVINACWSSSYAQKVADRTGAMTIAMRGKVADSAAIIFSKELYSAFADGQDIPTAFSIATEAVALNAANGRLVPKLFLPSRR